jgi:putative protease
MKIELLAPAGSPAALRAAVQSGAGAVYLGGELFSARQGADNFSLENMETWIRYCHLYGVKVHVAVNTLVKEKELLALEQYARELNQLDVDAVIVQDFGAVDILRSIAPKLPLHASTQMTVTSLEGVRFLEGLGFERVVLARELSRQQVERICRDAKAEIEVFVHGALCMSYSGQCLFSSILGGRSGNRGRCAQPCRLPYQIEDKKGHLLSPKDLCLAGELKTLQEIGVRSLKIEGRLKRPEYVSAVVGVYRRCLDGQRPPTREEQQELLNAFQRDGFTTAYFGGQTGAKMMSYKNPGNVAKQEFTPEAKQRALEQANIRKIPVSITAELKLGQPMRVTVEDTEGNKAVALGETAAEQAHNRPLEKERVQQQLGKLGATPFEAGHIGILLEEGLSLPVKELNQVRRKAVEELEELRCKRKKRVEKKLPVKEKAHRVQKPLKLFVEAQDLQQAEAAIRRGVDRLYVPAEVAGKLSKGAGPEIVTKLPPLDFDGAQENIATDAVLISNIAQSRIYQEKKQYGDFRLNLYNSYAADFFAQQMQSLTLSPELNLKEIRQVCSQTQAEIEVLAYGRLPLMLFQNCPLKSAGKCQKNQNRYVLTDRKKEQFPVLCGKGCVSSLLNAKPLFMADKLHDLKNLKINAVRLLFTVENSAECDTIISAYQSALRGDICQYRLEENTFTRGHFYRGAD